MSWSSAPVPLVLRVLCYLVVADFGHYWIHRLMHHERVWRIHKWHHAPDYMYWLMGVRTTLPQQVLVNLPYIFAYPFLALSPWWIAASCPSASEKVPPIRLFLGV
jgi:sterol desaturase/sphingolipid hydroxylase (fatty acid hydroxylase superfamily)